MKIYSTIFFAFVILLMIGCKSDTDSSVTKSEDKIKVETKRTTGPKEYEVRHVNKNKSTTTSAVRQENLKQKEVSIKQMEKEKNASNQKDDISFPKSTRLLTAQSIIKIFGVTKNELTRKSDSHDFSMGMSKSVWSWKSKNGENNKLNIIIAKNPSLGSYADWSKTSLDHYIKRGLPVSDGSKMVFKEIKKDGLRYAYNVDRKMLKWFHDEYFSINVTGFGDEFSEAKMMQLAKEINGKIASY